MSALKTIIIGALKDKAAKQTNRDDDDEDRDLLDALEEFDQAPDTRGKALAFRAALEAANKRSPASDDD